MILKIQHRQESSYLFDERISSKVWFNKMSKHIVPICLIFSFQACDHFNMEFKMALGSLIKWITLISESLIHDSKWCLLSLIVFKTLQFVLVQFSLKLMIQKINSHSMKGWNSYMYLQVSSSWYRFTFSSRAHSSLKNFLERWK